MKKSKKNVFPIDKYVETMICNDCIEAESKEEDKIFCIFLQTFDNTEPLIVDTAYESKQNMDESLVFAREKFANSLKIILQEYDQWKAKQK